MIQVELGLYARTLEQPHQELKWPSSTLVSTLIFTRICPAPTVARFSFNNVQAVNFGDIQYRTSDVINVGGFYFS